ncbi:hypothetical protein M5689_000227 [Euphorbia peplus]|nr:hypothetical protein M5689_000227 [Euphorbia peplus]
MASRAGSSFSRRLISAARAPARRSSPLLPGVRPPAGAAPRLHSRRFSFAPSRTLGEIGCTQSFLPLYSAHHLTSRLNTNLRAFCELSHGT